MLVLHVTIPVKPDRVSEFLELARYDAENSVKEPGCLGFDVIQDRDDPNRFYFHERYRDDAALDAHRQTVHFKTFIEKSQSCLAGAAERRYGTLVVPSDTGGR